MIRVPWPAKMECVQPGCSKHEPVDLFLTGAGGLVFRPQNASAKGWQVQIANGGTGPFACRCPEHAQLVETPVLGGTH